MTTVQDAASTVAALEAMAEERHPDDDVLPCFLRLYYRHLPDEDADDRRVDDIYAAALAHYRLGRVRAAGDVLVEVLSPDADRDGWQTDRSILLTISDDVPFLVSTVRMVLDRYGLGIHLLVHPMLDVRRKDDDAIATVEASAGDESGIEAWTQIEIDRCPPSRLAAVETAVRAAITDVQRVVADFVLMRDRVASLSDGNELIDWLTDPHFVFLGAASYMRQDDRLELQADTTLGLYRADGNLDPETIDPPSLPGDQRFVIARAETVSTIHRDARLTCLAIRPAGTDLEHRFVGLLGSAAYRESVFAIPVVSDRANEVLDLAGSSVRSHTGRAIKNTVETLPRDVVFEMDTDQLAHVVIGIVGLQERRIVRVFDIAEPVGPWTTVFVHVPSERFNAGLPDTVCKIVSERYGGEVRDIENLLGASSLARVWMSVRASQRPDLDRLGDAIDDVTRTWKERASSALVEALGEIEGRRVFDLIRNAVPADYRARVKPEAAASDLINVAALLDIDHVEERTGQSVSTMTAREAADGGGHLDPSDGDADDDVRIATTFGRSLDAPDDVLRFRIFLHGRSATMAELVPILEHLGMHALEERPSEFSCSFGSVYLYDIDVRIIGGRVDDDQYREVQETFVGLVRGSIEADGLNRLVLGAGLSARQVAVLRLYHRYLRQAGFALSSSYVERTLVEHPAIARSLIDLFDAKFDPAVASDMDERKRTMDDVRAGLAEQLDAIPSLDDDRICRAFSTLIEATVRTNAFVGSDEISVKLRPEQVSFLPEPRPEFEIFVCSPWVEGVHLRAGRIARGGLRWSDRPDDFRTEVLGLLKAQIVKNALIVPVGAKGGFVVKHGSTDPGDRDAVRAEGIDRYRRFITALLDLTDNVRDGDTVPPAGCVVHDDPDPYLVVAADKGTATFSDIANGIAIEHDFWLGDAFASGGSHGYDHKAMGITARGAWESVRRHARVLGKNVETDELTAVGIGDMSGDVFGNGMLLSEHLQLVAAFDHRHVFLDPDPDPAASHAERARLFALARSSWADYDTSIISDGGGVFSRSLKSVSISDEVREALGLDDVVRQLRPDELISAILRAPVDLLWNGGIGTYVKSSTETHDDVGDRGSDAVRIDATDLRCAIVGEGGNLGFTQLARVEFASAGGLIYTDAIDNSAGVDCSDHEVNMKIVLDRLVRAGDLTGKQRNSLMVEMTDEVAQLVLDNNRAQTLALMIARRQALPMVNVHARYLDALESDGEIDRQLESLPSDKVIAERQTAGNGMVTPEFAVMIAYTKNVDVREILDSDLPDDPALDADLLAYFPSDLRRRFPDELRSHRLRREIIAARIVNNMVNLSGISFDHRMTEGLGASITDVARAFVATRDVVRFDEFWWQINDLVDVDLDTQIDLFLELRRMAERGVTWMLRHRRTPLDIADTIETFESGLEFLATSLETVADGRVRSNVEELHDRRVDGGVPTDLAARSARWPWLHTGFDIVEVALARGREVADVATSYWAVFEAFELGWLWDGIGALPRSDRWQTQARAALRDDLMSAIATLTREVLEVADGEPDLWIAENERAVERVMAMHTEIRRAESFDLTTLSVGLRQLRNLTVTANL